MRREFIKYIGNHKTKMKVTTRYEIVGSNKEPYFSITAETYDACGCLHDEIREHFPELDPLIKWHLVSASEPLHYVANSLYWAEQGNLDNARSSAIWPDAELKDFTRLNLETRLPGLMNEFHSVIQKHFNEEVKS